MISRGIKVSISGDVVAMIHVLSLRRLFFSSSFCNHALFVSRYKKPYAALAMKRKNPIKQTTDCFTTSWEKSSTPSL